MDDVVAAFTRVPRSQMEIINLLDVGIVVVGSGVVVHALAILRRLSRAGDMGDQVVRVS
jgi:hypothetical protein